MVLAVVEPCLKVDKTGGVSVGKGDKHEKDQVACSGSDTTHPGVHPSKEGLSAVPLQQLLLMHPNDYLPTSFHCRKTELAL